MNTQTTELRAIAKAAYILDHGWKFIAPRSQQENNGIQLYKTWQRPFLTGVDLETAYAMQKAQEDQMGDKSPLEEAKKIVAGWPS